MCFSWSAWELETMPRWHLAPASQHARSMCVWPHFFSDILITGLQVPASPCMKSRPDKWTSSGWFGSWKKSWTKIQVTVPLCLTFVFWGQSPWCSCLLGSVYAGSIFTVGFSTLRKCSLKEWILPNRWDPFSVFPSISHPLVSSASLPGHPSPVRRGWN